MLLAVISTWKKKRKQDPGVLMVKMLSFSKTHQNILKQHNSYLKLL